MSSSTGRFWNVPVRHGQAALLIASLAAGSLCLRAATPAETERKIDALLAKMTLEEKLGQMSQDVFRGLAEKTKAEIRQGRWGSLFGGGTPAQRAEAQRLARESRLGIPLILGEDVIHGYTTIFPIPLGQTASWDPELVRQAARVAARESSAVGIQWTFSPMMDIARDPRWGRIAEGFGEDPYVASQMAAATARRRAAGTTTPRGSRKTCCATCTWPRSRRRGRPAWRPICPPSTI